MLLSFVGQLLKAEAKSFTPDTGANKGQLYQWTDLEFNTPEGGTFVLPTVSPVEVDSKNFRQDMQWSLEVEPRTSGGKTKFKVSKIGGSKIKPQA